jgi:RimJ/RimL family protein N-acetyltransferase
LLEPLVAAHAAAVYDYLRDERLYTFIPREPPASVDALEGRYRRLASRLSPDGREAWLNWIARQRSDGVPVGTFEATVYPDGAATLAYVIFVPFQRRGYAREGGRSVVAYLVREYGVGVVAAEIDTRNVASIALVEGLGFTRVATHHAADFFKGAVSDEYRYEYRPPMAAGPTR